MTQLKPVVPTELLLAAKDAWKAAADEVAASVESASLAQPEPMVILKRSLAVATSPKLVHASNTLPAKATSLFSKRAYASSPEARFSMSMPLPQL